MSFTFLTCGIKIYIRLHLNTENTADYRRGGFNCCGSSRRSACALITGNVAHVNACKHLDH